MEIRRNPTPGWMPRIGNGRGEAVGMRFRQFPRLMELVAEARKAGADIGSHNLLDSTITTNY